MLTNCPLTPKDDIKNVLTSESPRIKRIKMAYNKTSNAGNNTL